MNRRRLAPTAARAHRRATRAPVVLAVLALCSMPAGGCRMDRAASRVSTAADAAAAGAPAAAAPVMAQRATGRFLAARAAVPTVAVFARPGDRVAALTLADPTPSGSPLVFDAITARSGWLQVRLPVRPNGSTGWIRVDDVELVPHSFHIEIRLAERVLTVFDGDEVVQIEPIGVGRHPTPTPGGTFYLYELLRPPTPDGPYGPYGPYAFGLSGFSEALDQFNGGDGRLGLHGTDDPSSVGADSTNGCIRLTNPAIEVLVRTVPLGTPVTILA